MITVTFVSPAAVEYKIDNVAVIGSAPAALPYEMTCGGILIAGSIPMELLRAQTEQKDKPSWRIIVTDDDARYEFGGVWFHAHKVNESEYKVNFTGQSGPQNLLLGHL
jgi:hypothetical protein